MLEYHKITHQKVWEYLKEVAYYLTIEELETLNNLFELMEKDHTPIQNFGDSKLEFILKRERHPYINTTIPCYFTSNEENDTINKMLISFDTAKGHMELNELVFITFLLPMIIDYQMTIQLVEKDGEFVLSLKYKNKVDKCKNY